MQARFFVLIILILRHIEKAYEPNIPFYISDELTTIKIVFPKNADNSPKNYITKIGKSCKTKIIFVL